MSNSERTSSHGLTKPLATVAPTWRKALRRLSIEATAGLVRGVSTALGTAVVGWFVLWFQQH
ncbi:hypothetical protein ABZ281_42090 [Streptomyces sp. NPDC006265]|uniref:hypothetical protein n=1 Tax=Streptomyces sp. NPDC006265 TaxID=3156740 RepID=UPI0033AB40AC